MSLSNLLRENNYSIYSGNIETDSILFGTQSITPQSVLSFYSHVGSISVVFTDSNANTYNANIRCVRIGNLCNMTIRPTGNSFNVPLTCDYIISPTNSFPIDFRPLEDTYFTIGSLSGSPAQGVLLYASISTAGVIEINATSSGSTIPNANYVTASFNISYYCSA